MTVTAEKDASGITKELATGKFTDEMLADMRALIGTELRTEAEHQQRIRHPDRDPALLRGHRRRQSAVDRRELRGEHAARRADRAAELRLRLPRGGPGRMAGTGRLPLRDEDGLPQEHPRGRQDQVPGGLSGLRRPGREQLRRPPDQGLHPPGVQQPGRRGGRRVHLLAHALRAHRDAEARIEPRDHGSPPLDRRGARRDRGADPRREAPGRHAAHLGGRAGRRRDRRDHQGAARPDRLHRLHRRRLGADPARRGAFGRR